METKKCQFCGEEINIDAIKCKHCRADLRTYSEWWYRNRPERKLLGVCAMLSDGLMIPLYWVRLGGIFLAIFQPQLILLYLALGLFIPYSRRESAPINRFFKRIKDLLGFTPKQNENIAKVE
jgi:phage shock protein PspC (stress-responsive transcriptional regulator)